MRISVLHVDAQYALNTRAARVKTFQIKYFDTTYPFYQYQLRMTKHCGDMNYNVFSQNGA